MFVFNVWFPKPSFSQCEQLHTRTWSPFAGLGTCTIQGVLPGTIFATCPKRPCLVFTQLPGKAPDVMTVCIQYDTLTVYEYTMTEVKAGAAATR